MYLNNKEEAIAVRKKGLTLTWDVFKSKNWFSTVNSYTD